MTDANARGTPDVSIVIPIHNRAHCVGRAVASVLSQRPSDDGDPLPAWELIVVDDGSSDDGAAVVEAYGDPRVRVIRHPVNQGAASARNTGIAAARGSLVAFLDSDDEWTPEKLARQTAAMNRPDAPDVSFTGFVMSRDADGAAVIRRPALAPGAAGFLDGCFVAPGSTMMARRACLLAVGPFDASLPRLEDWDWLLRMTDSHRAVCLDATLAVIHQGGFPSYRSVADAAARMEQAHRERITAALGPHGWRRFRATMEIERGVALFRDQSTRGALPAVKGLRHLIRGFLLCPARFAPLALRLINRLTAKR